MKKFLFITFMCMSTLAYTQTACSLEELRQKPVFYSLEEALKNPLEVYSLKLYSQKLDKFPQEIFKFKNLMSLNQ